MAEDKDWFVRQASRTAEDIKQMPEWLRTRREDNEQPRQAPSAQETKEQKKTTFSA